MKASLKPKGTTQARLVVAAAKIDARFTGRRIFVYPRDITSTAIEKAALNESGLRIANIRDFRSASSPLVAAKQALEQADGVLFDLLKVAVAAPELEAGLSPVMTTKVRRLQMTTEMERFVYALPQRRTTKASASPLEDNAEATWGIHATNVLQSPLSGKGIRIAILDTGMNLNHPDFKGRKVKSETFVGQVVEDGDGHGSHCTGVAAGHTTKEIGFRYGVANQAEIYIGKVLRNNGEGEDNFVLAGIEWALENKCRVISMSLGSSVKPGETFYNSYETVARRALAQGTLIVAAAGNDSYRSRNRIKPVNHPANCPSIMAVGAIDKDYSVADFSCAGSAKIGNQVNIAAPGVDIFSSSKRGRYEILSGTSMATPFVAGIAALLWEKYPGSTAKGIWRKLTNTAKRLKHSRSDVGAGIVYLTPKR